MRQASEKGSSRPRARALGSTEFQLEDRRSINVVTARWSRPREYLALFGGALIGGCFGALFDQLTATISPLRATGFRATSNRFHGLQRARVYR
jgi:hypothetical protein